MFASRSSGGALLSAALVTVAACGGDGGTGPRATTPFDASHALATFEPLAVVFDQPIFASFRNAESFFESFFRSGISTTLTAVPATSVLRLAGSFRLPISRILAATAELRASAIPNELKGKTLVFDPGTRTYVPDPAATGAPPTGVRFLLYASDQLGPTSPLARIGLVDIAPAEGSADAVELVVIRDAPRAVVADFAVGHSVVAGVNDFAIEGSATDARTVALIELTGTESGTGNDHHLTYNTSLSSGDLGISAREQLVFDQATATESGRLELSYDGHTLTDESVATGAEVRFDGGLYARIVFPRTVDVEPQYLKPDGTPLTRQEIAGLNALLERVIVADFFWISLAFP